MEQAGYLRIFRDRWLVIVATVLVGLAIAVGAANSATRTYEANATLFLKVEADGASLFERSQFSLQRIKSYGDLVTRPDLLTSVISTVGLDVTPAELKGQLSAVNPVNTVLLVVTAEATDAEEAAAIANAAAAQLSRIVDEIENVADDDSSNIQLNVTIPAQTPASPSSPNVPVIIGLGVLGGAVVGLILAIILERTRPRVRAANDVRRITGLPLIAQLPLTLSYRWMFTDGIAPAAVEAALRTAASNLRAISKGNLPPIIALVPVGKRPGRAGTRIGIAHGLAATGRDVLLLETDIASQRTSRLPIIEETPGLSEVLSGKLEVSRAIVSVKNQSFKVLPAGSPYAVPSEFDTEHSVFGAMASMATTFDVTVLQAQATTRPLGLPALAPTIGGAILVTSFLRTSASELRRELSMLRALDIVPIGVIMTDVLPWRRASLLETWQEQDFVNTVAAAPAPAITTAKERAEAPTPLAQAKRGTRTTTRTRAKAAGSPASASPATAAPAAARGTVARTPRGETTVTPKPPTENETVDDTLTGFDDTTVEPERESND